MDKLNLRVGIDQEEFPLLYQALSSETNQMRRTRRLCALAERALRGSHQIEALMNPVVQTSTPPRNTPSPVSPVADSAGDVLPIKKSFVDAFEFNF